MLKKNGVFQFIFNWPSLKKKATLIGQQSRLGINFSKLFHRKENRALLDILKQSKELGSSTKMKQEKNLLQEQDLKTQLISLAGILINLINYSKYQKTIPTDNTQLTIKAGEIIKTTQKIEKQLFMQDLLEIQQMNTENSLHYVKIN